MPILCNVDGKKLSKRDFGFSLRDLKEAGFLPEAIVNYLAIIGASFKQEIMSLEELAQTINFDHISTTGQIKYDVEKLRWVNQKWINKLDGQNLITLCRPYLEPVFPQVADLSDDALLTLLTKIAPEMATLQDCVSLLAFYFTEPLCTQEHAYALVEPARLPALIDSIKTALTAETKEEFLTAFKTAIASSKIPTKEAFTFIRYVLTGSEKGLGIIDLINLLTYETIKRRLLIFL